MHCCRRDNTIWASSWDYGTYHIGDQRRLRRACASAQSRQSLCCSHTWRMEVDEGSDQKIRHLPHCLAAHARLKNEFTEDEKCHNLMSRLISPTCTADRAGTGQSGSRPKNTAFDRDFTVDGTIVFACYRVDTSVDYGCHRVDRAVDRQQLL